jgi:hypothetical protein
VEENNNEKSDKDGAHGLHSAHGKTTTIIRIKKSQNGHE